MVTLTNLTGPYSRVPSSLPFACPSNPDSATFEECLGRQGHWYTPHALSKALDSRAEKQLVEWPTAEEKSPQPAKATLAAPTQPLWVLTSVSGSSTLLWRWVWWTRPGPGTMLSDSALQSLQGLCTKGTQMVLALRGAFRTLCGYLSSRLVCPYTPRKRSNQASPHPSFLGILPLPSPPGYKESLC